jgi:hypothetical protein
MWGNGLYRTRCKFDTVYVGEYSLDYKEGFGVHFFSGQNLAKQDFQCGNTILMGRPLVSLFRNQAVPTIHLYLGFPNPA